ncbi:MAG: 16S rRNA processing protein RimM [Ruminococcaceae bacterium]|nr:16S rRNA processing protein RimM [Oscillospiraceae bacterium]
MAKQQYLECGKAVSTHGVRGTVRLECYCDTPEKLAKLRVMYRKTPNGEFVPMKIRASSVQKNMVLCTFEDLKSLDDAIPFKGTVLYASRNDIKLDEGDVFIADILGLDIIDADSGEKYGTLANVITPGGRDVYVIDDVLGGQFMVPVVAEFVKEVVTDGEREGIYVKLIEGMRE